MLVTRSGFGPGLVRAAARAAMVAVPLGLLATSAAFAQGALAVGVPAAGAGHGFTYAYIVNAPTSQQASENALAECRNSNDANDAARDACKVVADFKDQCLAVAFDPKRGAPGWGAAVADSSAEAQEHALWSCRERAGDRAQFCKLDKFACDGSAK